MSHGTLFLNLINVALTAVNTVFGIILEKKKTSFNKVTETTLLRYNYLEGVLIDPYMKLILTALFYDVLYYFVILFLSKILFQISTEDNEENIRTKSVKENLLSNIFVEMLFMVMIKGLALGFGFFYVYEMLIEIKRILNLGGLNQKQIDELKSMQNFVNFCGIAIIATVAYQILIYCIKFIKACKERRSFFFWTKKISATMGG